MRRNFSNITICYNLYLDSIDGVTYFNNIHSFLYSDKSIMQFSPLRSTSRAILFYWNDALQAINGQNSLKFE